VSERQVVLRFADDQPQRLDKFLVTCLPDFSRSRLQRLIKDGFVTVDDKVAHKPGQILERETVIRLRIPPPTTERLEPEKIPLDIVFENRDVLVINKPAGMVVHPAAGHSKGTLVHAVLAHAADIESVGEVVRPGVVHRLDKNTSGLILIARNEHAQRWLQDQFRARQVKKVYLALVDGKPPTPSGRIEAPIGRHNVHRKLMTIVTSSKGRAAISEYKTIEEFDQHTLLEVRPITGRTHQIRLHLNFIGCPVVGDTIYGRRKATIPLHRHFLHASRLTICLPGETQAREFVAPLPSELKSVLENLRT